MTSKMTLKPEYDPEVDPEDDLPPLVRGEGHQQAQATTSPLRMTAGLPPDNLQLALRLELITYLDQATNWQMEGSLGKQCHPSESNNHIHHV